MGAPATLAWAVDRLPASEFVVDLHGRADEVIDIVEGGVRRAVGVATRTDQALSGAPVSIAVMLDEVDAAGAFAAAVSPRVGGSAIELLGPFDHARLVAAALAGQHGGRVEPVMRQRLWRCVQVCPPDAVPGSARRMIAADHRLMAQWLDAFSDEALGLPPRGVDQWLQELGAVTGLRVWVVDGRPVSMVMGRVSTPVSARVGPVYTPPADRGRGYAAALTATVTAELLAAGAERVVLLTDLENPTSNRLYPRVGYEPVCPHESWVVRFG